LSWTPEQDEQLRELHGKGMSYPSMGIYFGMPGHVVRKRMKALGLVSKHKKLWTEVEDNLLVTMRGRAKSFVEIGAALNRGANACLQRHNLLMGRDSFDQHWPPTVDKWAVKVNFAEHELKLKPMRTVRVNTDHSNVRSVVGNSSAMCAP
jgi:hypothetical protein